MDEIEYKTIIIKKTDEINDVIKKEELNKWKYISKTDAKLISLNNKEIYILTFIRKKEHNPWFINQDVHGNIIIVFQNENCDIVTLPKEKAINAIMQLEVLEYQVNKTYSETKMEILMKMLQNNESEIDINIIWDTIYAMFGHFEYQYTQKTFMNMKLSKLGQHVSITTIKENYTVTNYTTPIPIELFEGEYLFSGTSKNNEPISVPLKIKMIGLNLEKNNFGKLYSLLYKLYLEGAEASKLDIHQFFNYLNRDIPEIYK